MHNLLQQVIFYIFAGLTVISAFMVITQNNPVRCVLFLVLAFISSSVLWLLLYAEFLALILVLVYVGAVMTLFLFVVMMLNIDVESRKKEIYKRLIGGLFIIALLVSLLLKTLPKEFITPQIETVASNTNQHHEMINFNSDHDKESNTEKLGMVLYTDYFLAFELAAVILLAAIISAITLAHRSPIRSKQQNVVKQIMTNRNERVKLVKINAEE